MEKLEAQYRGLGEALKLINEASGSKSQIKVADLSSIISSSTGKRGRGRPASASKAVKSKPGKRGPKPGARKKRGIKLNVAIRDHIKSVGRYVSSPELSNKFASHYPEKTKADFTKYISVLLSIAKKNKALNSTNLDKSGKEQRAAFWGLPEWFSNGKPKQDFYK